MNEVETLSNETKQNGVIMTEGNSYKFAQHFSKVLTYILQS